MEREVCVICGKEKATPMVKIGLIDQIILMISGELAHCSCIKDHAAKMNITEIFPDAIGDVCSIAV